MDNSRRLKCPQLCERSRKLLEAPESSFAKRHPLISTAIFTGALVVSGLFVSKYAKPCEEKVDADSARVAVSANASKTKDRWEQLKNILKMRKELKGKISRGSPVEDEESALSGDELKEKLFTMSNDALEEYRLDLEDEMEDVKEREEELGRLWPNMSEAEWEELEQLRKRSEELRENRWIATQENIGRGTELILANGVEWRDQSELLDWRREYIGMQSNGWNGLELKGDNEDYVNRMLVVLNWAIDARKQGYEPLRADLLFFRKEYAN